MTIRMLLVSLLVASSVGSTVPAAAAAPAVRLVEDYTLLDYRAGTTVEDQVSRTSEGLGPAFANAIGTSVTAARGTATVRSRARNLAILGRGQNPPLLEIDALTAISASATTDDAEAEGTPYADAWSVYTADFTVATTVPYTLDVDTVASSNDANNCTNVEVWLSGPSGVLYERTLGVGAEGWCGESAEAGALSGSLAPGEYRLVLEVLGEVDDSTAPASTSARAAANLQLGRGCDNDPSSYGSTVTGTAADDVLCGGLGDDVIDGQGGDDLILTGPGNDEVLAGAGDDAVYGSEGADRLDGGDGSDVLAGQDGADRIRGGWGRDTIDGGLGADELAGGYSPDRITGGGGSDTVDAGPGDDTVRGCDGTKDTLGGWRGTDRVFRDRVDDITGFETRSGC